MSKQITSIIIDDEPDARNELNRIIQKELPDVEVLTLVANAQSGLEAIIDKQPDVVFLDIQMPEKDGFWLADKLHKVNSKTEIIFITAFDEYAIEAIKYAAFDFILKPIDTSALKEGIIRFIEKKEKLDVGSRLESLNHFFTRDKIKFNNQNGFLMIAPEDIVYCEADGNYTLLQLHYGKKEIVTLQLGIIERKLSNYSFMRISRSRIVNLDYLEGYNRNTKKVSLITDLQKFELKASSSGARRLLHL